MMRSAANALAHPGNCRFFCALLVVPISSPQSSAQEPSAQTKAAQEAIKASNDLLKAQWTAWAARQKRARMAAPKNPAIAASAADRSRADERFRPAPEQAGLARSSTTPWYRPTEVVSVG